MKVTSIHTCQNNFTDNWEYLFIIFDFSCCIFERVCVLLVLVSICLCVFVSICSTCMFTEAGRANERKKERQRDREREGDIELHVAWLVLKIICETSTAGKVSISLPKIPYKRVYSETANQFQNLCQVTDMIFIYLKHI